MRTLCLNNTLTGIQRVYHQPVTNPGGSARQTRSRFIPTYKILPYQEVLRSKIRPKESQIAQGLAPKRARPSSKMIPQLGSLYTTFNKTSGSTSSPHLLPLTENRSNSYRPRRGSLELHLERLNWRNERTLHKSRQAVGNKTCWSHRVGCVHAKAAKILFR